MITIAYLRVSTIEQNIDRQLEVIKKAGFHLDQIYKESVSGKNLERSELKKMIDYLRPNDVVIVESLSRITRRTSDLLDLLKIFNEKNVRLISVTQNFDFQTSNGKLMLVLLGAISELERDLILERQREGIELAKKAGKYKGRKPIKRPSNFDECYEKYKTATVFNKYPLKKFALETGLSLTTLRKFIEEKRRIEEKKRRIESKLESQESQESSG